MPGSDHHELTHATDSASDTRNVDLAMRMAHTPLVVDQEVSFELLIENRGLHRANGVSILESVSEQLDDPNWTLVTTRSFPNPDSWTSILGPQIDGFLSRIDRRIRSCVRNLPGPG